MAVTNDHTPNTANTIAATLRITWSGTFFSIHEPVVTAIAATVASASHAPIAVPSGSPDFDARPAVASWVRSPNSATNTTNPHDSAICQNDVAARSGSCSSGGSSLRHRMNAPTRNITPTAASTGRCGSLLSSDPSSTASTT